MLTDCNEERLCAFIIIFKLIFLFWNKGDDEINFLSSPAVRILKKASALMYFINE